MASVINEEDTVGSYMEVTLVNDEKYEGTVFTCNPKEGLLVLLQNIQGQTSMKMLRTPYIKHYELKAVATKETELPSQLDHFQQLPSMHAGRDKSIFKHASSQLKTAESERMKHLSSMDKKTSIAACDAFAKVARLYPTITWSNEESVIRVTQYVIIVGEPDWTTPKALLVDGSPESEKPLVEKIQRALGTSKK